MTGLVPLRPMNVNQDETVYRNNTINNITDINTYALGQDDINSSISTYSNDLKRQINLDLLSNQGYKLDVDILDRGLKLISNFETSETWVSVTGTQSNNTTVGQFMQGSQSIQISATSATGSSYRDVTIDLNTFSDGTVSNLADYIELNFYIADVTKITTLDFWVYKSTGSRTTNIAKYTFLNNTLATGWNKKRVRKIDFTLSGTFSVADWANVTGIYINYAWASGTSYVSFDNFMMLPNVQSPYILLDRGYASNIDATSGTTLTLGNKTDGRWVDKIFATPFIDYLVIKNAVTGGYGQCYKIISYTDTTITTETTLPSITNNVSWEIQRPFLISKTANNSFIKEDNSNSMIKLASSFVASATNHITIVNTFKSVSKNQGYNLKATFQFRANSSKQGIVFDYIDNNNYKVVYITKNGTSSNIKIDKILVGTTTNIFTTANFTIANNDEIILVLRKRYNQIEVGASDVNNSYFSYKKDLTSSQLVDWESTLDNVLSSDIGFYSDLELRVLEFEATEYNVTLQAKPAKILTGTFASANTLVFNDNAIHRTSYVNYKYKSSGNPAGTVYLSSLASGTLTLSSSSMSENATIEIIIFN